MRALTVIPLVTDMWKSQEERHRGWTCSIRFILRGCRHNRWSHNH